MSYHLLSCESESNVLSQVTNRSFFYFHFAVFTLHKTTVSSHFTLHIDKHDVLLLVKMINKPNIGTSFRKSRRRLFQQLVLVNIATIRCSCFSLLAVPRQLHFSSESFLHLAKDDDEPDLFDYFDPLLSPHSYPNGISPDHKPKNIWNKNENPNGKSSLENDPLAIENKSNNDGTLAGQDLNGEGPDLFEYFDPRLSPHSYPDGISPDHKPKGIPNEYPNGISPENKPLEVENYQSDNDGSLAGDGDPLKLKKVERKQRSPGPGEKSFDVNTSQVFDPTISPHAYTSGTVPSTIVGDEGSFEGMAKTRTVGVLLIDHGSRKEASNLRLHDLAQFYQAESKDDENPKRIVRAAHMEIAQPSIQDGIEGLMRAGVDEIVCCPYFLSPGRHVQEDIPLLVETAMKELEQQKIIDNMPTVTVTDPVGSKTEIMVEAIDSLVKESYSNHDK